MSAPFGALGSVASSAIRVNRRQLLLLYYILGGAGKTLPTILHSRNMSLADRALACRAHHRAMRAQIDAGQFGYQLSAFLLRPEGCGRFFITVADFS